MRRRILCLAVCCLSLATSLSAQPLLHLADFEYRGAFRIDSADFGASSANYSQGPIAVDARNGTLFLVGHAHHQAVAEFAIPPLASARDLEALNVATRPLQEFATVLDRLSNPQGMDRIGGLMLLSGAPKPSLLVNAYEYYDAPADNTATSLVISDAADLEGSSVRGYFELQGGARTAGWATEIPSAWQSVLGGTQLAGHSSGIPINGRSSLGPSAFAFDAEQLLARDGGSVATVPLLDFPLASPLHEDLANDSGRNDLWTHLSRAVYGFVPEGYRTYVTVGFSGGHRSGVCYKCTQDDGNVCDGYCPRAAADRSTYYWLWDLDDLRRVKEGVLDPSSLRPYEHGEWPQIFAETELGGGSYDPERRRLYVTAQRADTSQGPYATPPVVLVFEVASAPAVIERRPPGTAPGGTPRRDRSAVPNG